MSAARPLRGCATRNHAVRRSRLLKSCSSLSLSGCAAVGRSDRGSVRSSVYRRTRRRWPVAHPVAIDGAARYEAGRGRVLVLSQHPSSPSQISPGALRVTVRAAINRRPRNKPAVSPRGHSDRFFLTFFFFCMFYETLLAITTQIGVAGWWSCRGAKDSSPVPLTDSPPCRLCVIAYMRVRPYA